MAAAGAEHERAEADVAFGQPCDIVLWPDVPTHVLAATGDLFPPAFQRRAARERLGLDTVEVPGGIWSLWLEDVELVSPRVAQHPEVVAAFLLAAPAVRAECLEAGDLGVDVVDFGWSGGGQGQNRTADLPLFSERRAPRPLTPSACENAPGPQPPKAAFGAYSA